MSKAAEQTATHRTTRVVCNETTRVRIEQLRAFDWPVARIADTLALPLDVVQDVWRRQDALFTAPAEPELMPCGTHAAFVRHYTRGEPIDQACVSAQRTYLSQRWGTRRIAICGTRSGYQSHLNRGEKPCERCRDEQRTYERERGRRRRAAERARKLVV